MILQEDPAVGIADSDPEAALSTKAARLQHEPGTTVGALYLDTGRPNGSYGIKVEDAHVGAQIMILDMMGNLGLGTFDPQAKLDVRGDVKIEGQLCVNGSCATTMKTEGHCVADTECNDTNYVFEKEIKDCTMSGCPKTLYTCFRGHCRKDDHVAP